MLAKLKTVFEEIAPTIKEFAESYVKKDKSVDNLTWLMGTLMKSGGVKDNAEAEKVGQEIFSTIGRFTDNLNAIRNTCATGKTKEAWLNEYIMSNTAMTDQEKIAYLNQANFALGMGNQIMQTAIQNPNFDVNAELNKVMQTATPVSNIAANPKNMMALNNQLAQQAVFMGTNGVAYPEALEIGLQAGQGMPRIFEENIAEAEDNSPFDNKLKMIASLAIKAGVATGKIPFLSKVLPVGAITNIACVGVESAKNLARVATGKIGVSAAVENIGRASVAAVADFCATGLPAKLLMPVPVVGPALSLAVGGYLATLSGQTIQKNIFAGINKVQSAAKSVVKTVGSKFNSLKDFVFGSSIKNKILAESKDV